MSNKLGSLNRGVHQVNHTAARPMTLAARSALPRAATRGNAFTLVELLVVIGIIAMLISILLPALNRARATAQQVACMSNQRQVSLGIASYAQANKGWLPAGYQVTGAFPPMYWSRTLITQGYVSEGVFMCPNASLDVPWRRTGHALDPNGSKHAPLAYILSIHVFGANHTAAYATLFPFRKITAFSNSSSVVTFFDGYYNSVAATYQVDDAYNIGALCADYGASPVPLIAHPRHVGKKIVVSFLDGHAATGLPGEFARIRTPLDAYQ